MTTYYQLRAVHQEIDENTHNIHRMSEPTFMETWGMLGLVMAANMVVVYIFYFFVQKRLLKESKNEGKEDSLFPKEVLDIKSSCSNNGCNVSKSISDKHLVLDGNTHLNGHIQVSETSGILLRHRVENIFSTMES